MFSLLNMNKIACVPAMEKGLSLMVFAAAPPIVNLNGFENPHKDFRIWFK